MGDRLTEASWVIVETRAMCEHTVERSLRDAGYRTCVPLARQLRRPHGQDRKAIAIMRPVFSGIVFVQDWRGWPERTVTGVYRLMRGPRGANATLSGRDIAIIQDRERSGAFETSYPRPPANGIVTRDDLVIGEQVEYEVSDRTILGALEELSEDGMAVVRSLVFGREVRINVAADALRASEG